MSMKYSVVLPHEAYRGKTYSEWICDWINWFFSVDPDRVNNGPVVFLKQFPPLTESGSDEVDSTTNEVLLSSYKNKPNIMVGDESLEVFDDQAIICPVIMAYWAAAYGPTDTEAFLRQRVRSDIDNGDDPPRQSQVTINGKNIELDASVNMGDYRFETPVFQLMVPDAEYGKSYKDFVEYPVEAGSFPAVGCGYFLLLKDLVPGQYTIHSHARGRSTENGDYYAELLYQISVRDRAEKHIPPKSGIIPAPLTRYAKKKLKDQLDNKGLTEKEFVELDGILNRSREMIKDTVRKERNMLAKFKQ